METETEGEQLFSLCRADTFQLGKLEAVQPACHGASPRLTRPAVPSKHLPLIFPLSLSIPSAPSLNYPKDRSNLKVPVQWDQEEQRVGRIRRVHPGGMFRGRLSGVLAGRCTKLPVLWYQASAGCNPLVQAKKPGNIMEWCGFHSDNIRPPEELLSIWWKQGCSSPHYSCDKTSSVSNSSQGWVRGAQLGLCAPCSTLHCPSAAKSGTDLVIHHIRVCDLWVAIIIIKQWSQNTPWVANASVLK